MPIAKVQLEDGRIAKFEVPEGTTPEQVEQFAAEQFSNTSVPTAQSTRKPVDINSGNVTRSALQGATFGFSDEIGSAIAAAAAKAAQAVGAVPGDSTYMQIYEEMQRDVSGQQKQFAEDHPLVDIGAQIVGGAGIGSGAFKGATTLPQIIKAGMTSGAKYGAAYGAGTAEQGLAERAKGAATGAAIGGVAGGILPALITGTGRIVGSVNSRVKDALNTKAVKGAENLAEAMTDDEAAVIVGEIAQRTGLTADDIASKMEKLGSKSTLADVDENFAYALHDAISRFSPAKSDVRRQFSERLLGEHGDTLKAISNNFDNYTADDVYAALDKSAKERAKIAGPLYEKAFKSAIPENLSKNPVFGVQNVQDALKQANRMAALDLDRVSVLKSGEMKTGKLNPVERLHYAKKALWDQAESLRRAGEREKARLIDGQRKAIDDVLNQIPEYAQARKIWSSSMEADNAALVGKDIFKMNSREFQEAIKGMNPHEIEMAKMGALSSAADKIEGIADNRSVSRKLIENESMRNKVKALFGGEDEVKSLTKNAEKWDTFRRTNSLMSQQSRTREFSQANQEMQAIIDTVSTGIKDKIINAITGERMNAKRAASVAKILSAEGLTKSDIDRIIYLNKKMFQPAIGTQASTQTLTREAIKPISQMQEKNNLNDYMRK